MDFRHSMPIRHRINHYNDLHIDHVVKLLKRESEYLHYTNEALAGEPFRLRANLYRGVPQAHHHSHELHP